MNVNWEVDSWRLEIAPNASALLHLPADQSTLSLSPPQKART